MEILAAVACLLGGLFFAFLVYGNLNYERHRARTGAVVPGRIVDAEWDMNTAGARPVLHRDTVSKAFPVIFGVVALGLLAVGGVRLAVGL